VTSLSKTAGSGGDVVASPELWLGGAVGRGGGGAFGRCGGEAGGAAGGVAGGVAVTSLSCDPAGGVPVASLELERGLGEVTGGVVMEALSLESRLGEDTNGVTEHIHRTNCLRTAMSMEPTAPAA
jgi:hypothetical protein